MPHAPDHTAAELSAKIRDGLDARGYPLNVGEDAVVGIFRRWDFITGLLAEHEEALTEAGLLGGLRGRDVKHIIKSLGGAAELARLLGMPEGGVGATAVRAWSLRDAIPGNWFAAIERVARAKGRLDISVSSLAALAERRRLSQGA